jgi:hypothetical protein
MKSYSLTFAVQFAFGISVLLQIVANDALEAADPLSQNDSMHELPSQVENFRLLDQTGRSVELYRAVDAPAVVIYIHGVGCPMVRQIIPELTRIQKVYEPQGVKFYMLNANSQDSRSDLLKDAKKYKIRIPILKDDSQRITHALGCRRTAEVLVLDPQLDWKIIYRGPVDDRFNYGAQKKKATHTWLRNALQSHLAGKPIAEKQIAPKGCLIRFLDNNEISYTNKVAPILLAKCVSCHSEGGVGPFAMSSYREVAGWADMMQETIRTERMPPWHADREYGTFHNSLGLSVEEERILLAWFEQGAKSDAEAIDPLQAHDASQQASRHHETWQLGKPDLVLQLSQEQRIPAEGVVDYRYLSVPSGLTEDRWVRAIDVQPTNLAVVHHALIFILYPPQYRHLQPEAKNGLNGFFASYLPGGNVQPLPKDTGCFVPAGSTFIFQMHFTTTGIEERDQTQMGLYFCNQPPQQVFRIRAAAMMDFVIPSHAADSPAEATYRFRKDAQLLGLSPHMHYRGSRFRYDAKYPDGKVQTVLSVPHYEFDWQPMYYFEKPIPISRGTQLHCVGAFDNSAFNPRNPNPEEEVRFGEQSFEEMFIGYVASSVPYRQEDFVAREVNPDHWAGFGKQITAETLTGTTWSMGKRFRFHFLQGGTLKINGKFPGSWNLDSKSIHLKAGPRNIDLNIRLDELVFKGRPLQRIPQGG